LSGVGFHETLADNFQLLQFTMAVTKTGQGSGVVTSSPAGIGCGATCSLSNIPYGSTETLTAAPDAGAAFTTWTGACNGQGPTCTLTIVGDTSTNAVFGLATGTTTDKTTTTTTTTTVSSPNGTSTVTTPTPTTPTVPASSTRTKLAARIVYATILGRGGKRTLHIKIRVSELATAQIRVVHAGRQALAKSYAVKPVANELTAAIPARLPPGTYRLTITLTDSAGHTKMYTATVLMPA
jgi:hypothetical protein